MLILITDQSPTPLALGTVYAGGRWLWMLAKSFEEHSILRRATTGGRIGLTANRAQAGIEQQRLKLRRAPTQSLP